MTKDDEPDKLLLTVAETAAWLGIGEKRLRSIIAYRPDFPVVQVSPHRILLSRFRVLRWLGQYGVDVADVSEIAREESYRESR